MQRKTGTLEEKPVLHTKTAILRAEELLLAISGLEESFDANQRMGIKFSRDLWNHTRIGSGKLNEAASNGTSLLFNAYRYGRSLHSKLGPGHRTMGKLFQDPKIALAKNPFFSANYYI